MTPTLCACGCKKTTKLIRGRSNDVKRGIIAGSYRKYASHRCYLNDRQANSSTDCSRGHIKDKRHASGHMRCSKCDRANHRVRKYGISLEFALAAPQECELCGVHEDNAPHGTLTLDHCHETTEFRGWLCLNCNIILGHAQDDIGLLKLAIEYLKNRS